MKPEKIRNYYSDQELEEFDSIILEKIAKAESDLQEEEDTFLANRLVEFIADLKLAQIRIINKTYGICRETGKLISKERLKSVPHATLSIEAKLQQPEKQKTEAVSKRAEVASIVQMSKGQFKPESIKLSFR